MKTIRNTLTTGLLTVFFVTAAAQIPDASLLLDRSRDLTVSDALKATVTLTITDKNGSSRVRTNEMISKKGTDGTEKRLIRFISPAEVAGTAILIYDHKDSQDEMWIYLPALKRVRRIVSTEKGKSFMGSEFTNSDISSPPSSDFVSKHLEGSGSNGVYIIESIPKDNTTASDYGYARRINYLETGTLYLKKIEFFDKNNVHFKTINIKSVFKTGAGGKYMISEMEATNHANGRFSSIKMADISTTVNPPDAIFDSRNLDR